MFLQKHQLKNWRKGIHNMEKLHLYDKIISPMVTEKTTNLSEQNKIVFKVPMSANKINLKRNIEKIFKVNVIKVNIINKQIRNKLTRGRKIKVSGFKKAIVPFANQPKDPVPGLSVYAVKHLSAALEALEAI